MSVRYASPELHRALGGAHALVDALHLLIAPLSTAGRLQCSSCFAQYQQSTRGVELCGRHVAGELRTFVCSSCKGRS